MRMRRTTRPTRPPPLTEPMRTSVTTTASSSSSYTAASGDFSNAVPGKPLLAALAAVFNALEQQQEPLTLPLALHADETNNSSSGSVELEARRRTRRLSSARSSLGFAAVDAGGASASTADSAAVPSVPRDEFVLRINAQSLFYVQELLRAMLTPVVSDSGLTTQWRIDSHFLDSLEDAEASDLGPASPVKILTLGGHLLEQTALVIHGASSSDANIGAPASFDLALFPRLQYLRLDRCDLRDVKSLSLFRSRLKELRCYNQPIGSLSALLAATEATGDTEPRPAVPLPAATLSTDTSHCSSAAWMQLESFAAVNCSLAALDASTLALLPCVKAMRLSQNTLQCLAPLAACPSLRELDVSRNCIRSLIGASSAALAQLLVLDLSHNALESTAGIEHLCALEVLNLSHNALARVTEVAHLAVLPNLHSLLLLGNPIASASTYRADVQRLLTAEVMLDGVPWESQGVDDFASQALADLDCELAVGSERSRVAGLARSVLLAVSAIALVQSGIRLAHWSSDDESERLLLRVFAPLAVAAALLLATCSVLSRTANHLARRAAVTPRTSLSLCSALSQQQQSATRSDTTDGSTSLQRLSRRLSTCLVGDTYVRQETPTASGSYAVSASSSNGGGSTSDARVSLDVLHTSLQRLAESPEELSLLVFLNVCAELQRMLALLSPASSDGGVVFACNALARAIAALEAGARDLRTATVGDVLADAATPSPPMSSSSSSDAVTAVSAMREALDVLAFVARFLLALTDKPLPPSDVVESASASVLHTHVLAAYRHVFAESHPWIVQRAIANSVAASQLSPRAFLAALRRGNERRVGSEQVLVDWLRGCGRQLQTLHDQLKDQMLETGHAL